MTAEPELTTLTRYLTLRLYILHPLHVNCRFWDELVEAAKLKSLLLPLVLQGAANQAGQQAQQSHMWTCQQTAAGKPQDPSAAFACCAAHSVRT